MAPKSVLKDAHCVPGLMTLLRCKHLGMPVSVLVVCVCVIYASVVSESIVSLTP